MLLYLKPFENSDRIKPISSNKAQINSFPPFFSRQIKKCNSLLQRESRAKLAKNIYDSRRNRESFFSHRLFAEPAWDIILTLYQAHCNEQRLSVSDVCISARVPVTIALGWIEKLQIVNLLEKQKHPTDDRVTWVYLSESGVQDIEGYLDKIIGGF